MEKEEKTIKLVNFYREKLRELRLIEAQMVMSGGHTDDELDAIEENIAYIKKIYRDALSEEKQMKEGKVK